MAGTTTPKHTPLRDTHLGMGARMVAFAGWELPVHFSGIREEHLAVRRHVGLFDISHMGEFVVEGSDAPSALNRLLTNDLRATVVGQGQYTLLCDEHGGILDDLIVYRERATLFYLVVNSANTESDFEWLRLHLGANVNLVNESDHTGALALQGPAAAAVLPEAAPLKRFHIGHYRVGGVDCVVARTGYTGEDGFELFCNDNQVEALWQELMRRGQPHGLRPCGLGARDSLRLEMGYPLHGQDISQNTTPLQAGLDRFVAFEKGAFIGRDALLEQRQRGISRKLTAFRMTGHAPPPRPHYRIMRDGQPIGETTSGALSYMLNTGIGMGYAATAYAQAGQTIEIEVRGHCYPAVITTKPIIQLKS